MKVSAEEFNRLHQIAKAADAVARLDYPCTCYQHDCPHGDLIKALGWVGVGVPVQTFTVLIFAYPGSKLILESSVDAPDREAALESARDYFNDYVQRGYAVEIRDPKTESKRDKVG